MSQLYSCTMSLLFFTFHFVSKVKLLDSTDFNLCCINKLWIFIDTVYPLSVEEETKWKLGYFPSFERGFRATEDTPVISQYEQTEDSDQEVNKWKDRTSFPDFPSLVSPVSIKIMFAENFGAVWVFFNTKFFVWRQSSFRATMESLVPFQTLENNLPDYNSYRSFHPQPHMYNDGQVRGTEPIVLLTRRNKLTI